MRVCKTILTGCTLVALSGCANVNLGGGEKPIHIIMDVNLKIDRELDRFFAFQQNMEGLSTQPATEPATTGDAAHQQLAE